MTVPKGATLQVAEIFRSIQGESTRAGRPCAFVRLSGCNLRCRYCDTGYARSGGTAMAPAAIREQVVAFRTALEEVTGGEPLLQAGTVPLLHQLCADVPEVLVETNGSLLLEEGQRPYHVILDIKCPGSGETTRVEWRNLGRLQPGDEIKFVICDRADFDWAAACAREHGLANQSVPVLMSPASDSLKPAHLAGWILDSGLELRLQLQLHRLVWPERNRGV